MKPKKSLKIIEKKNLWFVFSFTVIFIGFSVMGYRAFHSKPILNYGIDFVSGSSYFLKFEELQKLSDEQNNKSLSQQDINLNFIKKIRQTLKKKNLENSTIQITRDKEVIIKCRLQDNKTSEELIEFLQNELGGIDILEKDFIGPTIGQELRETSGWIIGLVSVALLLFITWRFELVFGLAALVALLHDALVTISISALLFIEVNTAFVAAILTILGYSINDTIVVFDRIRENKKAQNDMSIIQIANLSLTQTMRRTINTSITTMTVIGCLLIFGGTTIKPFCLILLIGILAGTYSSIFIASPFLVVFSKKMQS